MMAWKIGVMLRWVLVCALPLIASCEKESKPLRISINAWPGYEFLYLAEQKGFFNDEGVNVKLVQLGSLSDTRRAFDRNKVDGMAATLIEVIQSNKEGERVPQVVLVTDYSNGADFILGQPEIKYIGQLKGKRVGLELGSLGVFMLARMLERGGLTLNDVELISSDQSSMEAMFKRKELDAVVTYPPAALLMLKDKGVNTLFTSAEIPGEVIDVVAIDREIVQKYPEKVTGLIRGFYRAIKYAEENPDESFKIMGEREGLSAADFREGLKSGIHMITLEEQREYYGGDQRLIKSLKNVEKVLLETGQINKKIEASELINSEPLKAMGVLRL